MGMVLRFMMLLLTLFVTDLMGSDILSYLPMLRRMYVLATYVQTALLLASC
jgi:hypothetical protein